MFWRRLRPCDAGISCRHQNPGGLFRGVARRLLLLGIALATWRYGHAGGQLAAQESASLGLPLAAFSAWKLPGQWPLADDLLWTDCSIRGQWRLQQHSLRPRYRVLDPDKKVVASGDRTTCQQQWDRLQRQGLLPVVRGRVVVTLHGLGRTGRHMEGLGQYLRDTEGYQWINFSYASTRQPVEAHAAALSEVLQGLPDATSIDIVAHSLGNIVVRRYLGEANRPHPKWQIDGRLRRMVMLGPPNQGARLARVIADLVRDNDWARWLAGPSAWELARQWDDLAQELATPPFPFAVVAGGTGTAVGLNPLVPGDDDGVVAVSETRLDGMAEFYVVPCRHGVIVDDPRVRRFVAEFLKRPTLKPTAEMGDRSAEARDRQADSPAAPPVAPGSSR